MKKRLIAVQHTDLTPEVVAHQIVLDAFQTQKNKPFLVVPSPLPIPMSLGSRRRVARYFGVHPDRMWHSMYDRAIAEIEAHTPSKGVDE